MRETIAEKRKSHRIDCCHEKFEDVPRTRAKLKLKCRLSQTSHHGHDDSFGHFLRWQTLNVSRF